MKISTKGRYALISNKGHGGSYRLARYLDGISLQDVIDGNNI